MSRLRLPTLGLLAGLPASLHRLAEGSGAPGVMYARISEDRKGAGLGVERQLEDQCVAHRGHRLGVLVMTTPPDATHTSPRWSVRTAGYRNPHRGALDQGGQSSGAARVGFTPQPDPFEPGPLWLGSSADPPRCGPTCLTTATRQPTNGCD